jgi:hypothetical protein
MPRGEGLHEWAFKLEAWDVRLAGGADVCGSTWRRA